MPGPLARVVIDLVFSTKNLRGPEKVTPQKKLRLLNAERQDWEQVAQRRSHTIEDLKGQATVVGQRPGTTPAGLPGT